MERRKQKINRKKVSDEKVISALITHPSIREASKVCNLSESQIYARLRNPEFSKLYAEARRKLLADCTAAMQSQLCDAVETMSNIMRDEKTPAQTRLTAAEGIIRNYLKLNEQTNFAERLEAIERARGIKT